MINSISVCCQTAVSVSGMLEAQSSSGSGSALGATRAQAQGGGKRQVIVADDMTTQQPSGGGGGCCG